MGRRAKRIFAFRDDFSGEIVRDVTRVGSVVIESTRGSRGSDDEGIC